MLGSNLTAAAAIPVLPDDPSFVTEIGTSSVNTSPPVSVVVTFTNLFVVALLAEEASTVAS